METFPISRSRTSHTHEELDSTEYICRRYQTIARNDKHLRQDIAQAFQQMEQLKAMHPGQHYTLPVHGQAISGTKEAFLRARTIAEIQDSGLSSGCGDYALAFLQLLEQHGYQTLLVDSAALSTLSLANHFSGHAVVAVRNDDQPYWHLADPTRRKIMDTTWSPDTTSFRISGRTYWIGYCGPIDHYPVSDATSLRSFYRHTLAHVPQDVLNTNLLRLNFAVDDSLKEPDDTYVNPHLSGFLNHQSEVFVRYNLSPQTEISVQLTRGEDDYASRIQQTESGEWVAMIGSKSGCSLSLLDYLENAIIRRLYD